ncbi:DUF86 domain-containing protein [Vulcanisaeta distributa]|uniref:HepT-like ribonuclease domain-containing protein n=1 Tax=Vulcanisaeta distributa TaxID=164451 RepID=UPI000A54252C|nr:HepT-like ribonuclease domain-containing protein [Vulcanisaeta distributa]
MGIAVEGYSGIAKKLREKGLMTGEEEALVKSLVGFRNVVVHGYANLDSTWSIRYSSRGIIGESSN